MRQDFGANGASLADPSCKLCGDPTEDCYKRMRLTTYGSLTLLPWQGKLYGPSAKDGMGRIHSRPL